MLAAREIVKKQVHRRRPAPAPRPRQPTPTATSTGAATVNPASAGGYSSFHHHQHVMVYNKEATPYGGSFLPIGVSLCDSQEDPYSVRNMVSAIVEQCDDLLDTCLGPILRWMVAYVFALLVNSCDLDQWSGFRSVVWGATDRAAQTMKGTIDDVPCAIPSLRRSLLNVAECMDPTLGAMKVVYDTDSTTCASGRLEAQAIGCAGPRCSACHRNIDSYYHRRDNDPVEFGASDSSRRPGGRHVAVEM